MRLRRRDGSGRGASLGPHSGADATDSRPAAIVAPVPVVEDVPAHTPAVVSRARTVAIVAEPESCIACGACVDACPRGAIALEETAVIDPRLCNGCGICTNECSYGALALVEV